MGKASGVRLRIKGKFRRSLAVAIMGAGGIAVASLTVAAERDSVLEILQAQCIQEGMLRGFAGESLKGFVNTCVELKRNAPPSELKRFSVEPAVC